MTEKRPVAVIGAGAWGTALAWSIGENGTPVRIWSFEPAAADSINSSRENASYLPGVELPPAVSASSDMAEVMDGCRLAVFVTPAQFMRKTLEALAPHVAPGTIVVSATKGIEKRTLALPVDMINDALGADAAGRACCLSGPTFARELVEKAPTAATIASADHAAAREAQEALSAPYFRLYVHDDVVGVELGGALKNVIAIAAGIGEGMGFGHNTRAALITRGLAEMTRLGVAMGAGERTFAGLAGMGDLVLTCSGDLSRNRTVGMRLGKGERLEAIIGSMKAVAEGVPTAESVYHLSRKQGVEMPICDEVYNVLYEGKSPKEAVAGLMGRALKEEFYAPGPGGLAGG